MDSAKDLSTSFSTMRNLALGSVLALLLVALASGFLVYRAYENSGRRVYVVCANRLGGGPFGRQRRPHAPTRPATWCASSCKPCSATTNTPTRPTWTRPCP